MTDLGTRDRTAATLRTSDNASDPAISWKVKCLNCGAALAGAFCAECGQRAVPSHPTVKELAGEAASEFLGWDGKLAETIRTLIQKPGELTQQWIEGRRFHFISPLRLYLTASLVFFVVTAAVPNFIPTAPGTLAGGLKVGVTQSRPERVGNEAAAAITSKKALTGPQRDSALADIATAPKILQPMLRRAVDEPAAFTDALRRALPRVLFGLVPVFAGILALFYRRRHYPEHFYFGIHLHAFFFIARTVGNLALLTKSFIFVACVQVAMIVWIVVYVLKALRRVYGGSLAMTLAKALGVFAIYAVIASSVIVAMALVVAG